MSGTINYAQLLPTSLSAGSSLLDAIYGTGAAAAETPSSALAALANAERNQNQDIANTASQPSVARDIAQFTAAVTSAKSVSQLLANPVVLKVLLTANGLGADVGENALAQKALTSDLNDPASLANTLPDTTWRTTAATYQFATQGLAVIQQPTVIQTLASAYAEVQWRQSLDQTYPGLSNALTFRAEASSITNVQQILDDPILFDVVTTALGIPQLIAIQPLEAQENAITSQLDVAQFQKPGFAEQFTQQYLVAMAQNGSNQNATPSLTALATSAAGLIA